MVSLCLSRAPTCFVSYDAPPTPHNRVQNKHVKIFHRVRVLYMCTVQRVLKTHWDSRRLDWTGLGRCEHPLTLESDWTGLDSTRLCWCVRTLSVAWQVIFDILLPVRIVTGVSLLCLEDLVFLI
jgi:hypothetical protein